jgi:hypothetical protein
MLPIHPFCFSSLFSAPSSLQQTNCFAFYIGGGELRFSHASVSKSGVKMQPSLQPLLFDSNNGTESTNASAHFLPVEPN